MHEAPVAELVAEALDDDAPVGRQGPGGLALVLEVGDEVLGGQLVEVVLLPQPGQRSRPARGPPAEVGFDLPHERPERPAQLDRPADRIALPERELPRLARRGLDEDPVRRDLGHAPAAGPEHDDVAVHAGAELVDHLLVELADAAAGRPRLAHDEDAVEAAVRDRPARGDGDDPGVPPALDRVGDPIPDEARPQLGELVGRVGAGEHRQHPLERVAGERLEGEGARDHGLDLVHRPAVPDGHRDELLGEDVERVAGDGGRLDQALAHPLGDDGALDEVTAVLRKDDAGAHLVDLVARPPDPLQTAGDRGRRLDLDDEVDRPHVDPELEGGRGHERRQAPFLERLLDGDALLAGDGTVVGAHEVLPGELVEALGEPLGEAPAVDEDEGAAVRPDELQDPRVDRRPDADPHLAAGHGPARLLLERQRLAEPAHVLDGDDHPEVEALTRSRVDDRDLASRSDAGEEPPDRLEGPLRRREADSLERRGAGAAEVLEALERQRQVGSALRPRDRVDLVDDHRLHAAQRLAGGGGEQQVERLRRRDEDLGRGLGQRAALVRRRVAGARRDRHRADRRPEPLAGKGDPRQRRPQVPLHVIRQRLEGADVEDPDRRAACGRPRRGRRADEPVETPEERGKGLAAAGGCVDEDVAAAGDRRPALDLRPRRGRERGLEPCRDGRPEPRERVLGERGRGGALGRIGAAGHGRPSIRRRDQTDRVFDSPRPSPAVPPPGRA